ncbi:hypothetical protein FRC09_010952 [Ceratobasidium sp. 395]|nr:hypothetical protein FRC09_010952 [Ceratobasidium sp. 395]
MALQRQSYLNKLVNQDEINRQLSEHSRQLADHWGRLDRKSWLQDLPGFFLTYPASSMPAPAAHINADSAQPPRRRTVRNATKLIAHYVARVATIPSTQFSVQTVRNVIGELKPTLLQAPKTNDKAIKQALARIEEIQMDVAHIDEAIKQLDVTNADPPALRFWCELQRLSDLDSDLLSFSQSSEKRLKALQRQSYVNKLANQDEIIQQLSTYNRKLGDHLGELQLKSAALAGYVATKAPETNGCNLQGAQQEPNAQDKMENVGHAFRLCAVPGTPHDLSYESLVGVAAWQAIVALSRTNPALYMGLISNADSPPTGSTEEDQNDELPIDETEDDDTNPTVDEVCRLILDSESAHHAAQPTCGDVDAPEIEEPEGAASVLPPAQMAIATRPNRAARRSLRLLSRGRGA